MKKYFLIILIITGIVKLFSQTICNSWNGPSNSLCQLTSNSIKPNSKIRVLNIFINVIYDVTDSLNTTFISNGAWPRAYNEGVNNEAIPSYLLGFMDTVYSSQNKGVLTRSFGESSFDSLQMIGDFVVVNVNESRVLTFPGDATYCKGTSFCFSNIAKAAIDVINANGGLQTLYGRNSIADYDYEHNNKIYFTNTMIRNITPEYGGLSGGSGKGGQFFDTKKIKIGNQQYSFNKGTTQGIGSGDQSTNINSIIRHEISHSLLGDNAFHTSGGNHRGSTERMPFLTIQGGHGLFGGSGLITCNGYERWRLHWKHSNSPNYITARNISNTNYVTSDIKKEDGNKSFILRDFVTYGDAVRIKLPYKDSENASNQYIWLENHQIGKYGNLDFLEYSNPNVSCRPAGMPGIYAYYQIGRDILSGTSSQVWFTNERDNLKIISAEGYWNYDVLNVPQYKINCINYEWHNYILERKDANPFCGYQDQEVQIHPFSNDNIIKLAHQFPMWQKRIGNTDIDSLPSSGDNRDAFSVHSKINMSTNPSTCNAKTYYNFLYETGTYNYTDNAYRNNETTYLTGLSIEMTPQSNNTFLVNIRWDDYDITNSANWTGKIALKEKAILKSGNIINLVQNKTPAQFTKNAQSGYFAKTSLFTCESNSEFLQESNTAFIAKEKSKILLQSGSKYTISQGANLTISSGCTLEVEDCAILEIKGKLIVENGASIICHPNTVIVMDSLSKIVYSGNVQLLIYPYIWINPIVTGNITLNQPITFNNNVIIHSGATLTVTSIMNMGANCTITIHPGAKLIVNGGMLTNACPDKMWEGILVGGNTNASQTAKNQGTLELKNGAVIENARNAIATYSRNNNGNIDWNTRGGIIKADNTTFRNNCRSVEFLKYPPDGTNPVPNNVSYFKNCTFTVNDANLFASNNASFDAHITMWAVTGVTINGCTFENNITAMFNRKQAIYTEDAGYLIDEACPSGAYNTGTCKCSKPVLSVFKGFNRAIESVNAGKQYTISIDRGKFENNNYAIHLSGKNSFKIVRSDLLLGNNNTGIYLDECTGYTVEGNEIYSTASSSATGIHVHRPGTDENKIYRNHIYNTQYGINVTQMQTQRGFPATGLQFLCNDLSNNSYDIKVNKPAVIRASQGSASCGADNLFSTPATYNFYVNTPNGFVDYYYDPAVSRKYPTYRSSLVTPKTAIANPCGNTLCKNSPPQNKSVSSETPLAAYRELNQQYAEMMSIFYTKGYDKILNDYYNGIIENEELLKEAIAYHEKILKVTEMMATISNEALFTLKTDSLIDLLQIRDWYNEIYTLNAKYSLAETYYQLAQFAEGFKTLTLIPEKYNLTDNEMIEHNNYVSLYLFKNEIRESGRTIAQLNEAEVEKMRYFATASSGLSSIMARGILCFFYDICMEEESGEDKMMRQLDDEMIRRLDDEVINQSTSAQSVSSEFKNNALEDISLVPNPTTGELTITNYELRIESIEVFDVYGRKQSHSSLVTRHEIGKAVIDISHLQSGIYFVKITTEQGEVVKKIIKQ